MDLNAPLGMSPPPPEPPRRRRRVAAIVGGGCIAVGVLGALGFFLATADPHGGEPYGVASIPPAAPKPVREVALSKPTDPSPTGALPPAPRMTAMAPSLEVPRPQVGPAVGGPLVIDVAKVLAERRQGRDQTATLVAPAVPAPAVPEAVVSAPAAPALSPPPPALAPPGEAAAEPKIAIVVASMGFGETATRTATEIMPAAVTFAFTPYGDTIAAAVAAAKAKGHEILMQMPMKDAAGPAPGPYAMHAGEPAPEVAVDAAWAFGRYAGYAGVSNFLGAAVTSDKPVMEALLRAVGARNLFYFDDGTSRGSLGPVVARQQGVAAVRADVVLDATGNPAVVRANLEALAALAKRKGAAIGLASGLPDHLAAIAAFAGGLRARGITLVPVGALATRAASVVVAQ